MRNNSKGSVLVGVISVMLVLMILIPILVRWVGDEAKWSVKEQKNNTAFNLAEAAVDRGQWKLMSSTPVWAAASIGSSVSGYNFDVTYTDIPGGTYRIKFTSTTFDGEPAVIIQGEGRDSAVKQVRAIQGIFENAAFPGPVLSQGALASSGTVAAHWGPLMSQGRINIYGASGARYYPRKFSKQDVICSVAGNLRDTNGVTPPNTSATLATQDWWSAYNVPDLPQLDFSTMRSSAAANGTLNHYNVDPSSTGHTGGIVCRHADTTAFVGGLSHQYHFADSNSDPLSKKGLIWYYDSDLVLTGDSSYNSNHNTGLVGTLIVMGNLTIDDFDDDWGYTGPIPQNAWKEYAAFDTAATGEYPGDNGYQTNNLTFNHGSESWAGSVGCPPPGSPLYTDVGVEGLIYVGGNFTITGASNADLAGVLWVKGATQILPLGVDPTLIFYEKPVGIPVLNVVLKRDAWREVSPDNTVSWP